MKPQRQTHRDNCVQACVASLLELELDEVPRFQPLTWWDELAGWLEHRGMAAVNVRLEAEGGCAIRGYTLSAVLPNGDHHPPGWEHCVICYNGEVIYDPLEEEVLCRNQYPPTHVILYSIDPARTH